MSDSANQPKVLVVQTPRRHANLPVHIATPSTRGQHIHYLNSCPDCKKISQCRCEAKYKVNHFFPCGKCVTLEAERKLAIQHKADQDRQLMEKVSQNLPKEDTNVTLATLLEKFSMLQKSIEELKVQQLGEKVETPEQTEGEQTKTIESKSVSEGESEVAGKIIVGVEAESIVVEGETKVEEVVVTDEPKGESLTPEATEEVEIVANTTPESETGGVRQSDTKSKSFVDKMVSVKCEGVSIIGRVKSILGGGMISLQLALPNQKGVVILTDSVIAIPSEGMEEVAAAYTEKKVRIFSDSIPFMMDQKEVTIRDPLTNRITDYFDVTLTGFASTFQGVTPADRDGDYVLPNAFDKTLLEFSKNPVMLIDHNNTVGNMVGSFTKVVPNRDGLMVQGSISNAPDCQRVRFLVAEGHLKAFSIGGMFMYGSNGKAIEEVQLYEISLVPIPANPDALLSRRMVSMSDAVKSWDKFSKK